MNGPSAARPIGLHQISVMDADPLEFVDVAAAAGCDRISIFTFSPVPVLPGQKSRFLFPTVTREMQHAMRQRLVAQGVAVMGVEYFPITGDADVAEYIGGLSLGRTLGAKRAVTHVHDTDGARAVDKLGALCDLAAKEGLAVGLEFCSLTRGCGSLQRAAWFVDQIKRPNFGIGVDCLHLVRSGGTAADLARLDARYFGYAQLCDGFGLAPSTDYITESHDRELPGEGDFPLETILNALPAATALEVEVPSAKRVKAGVTALEHARRAMTRARALVDRAAATR
jgi:sugar phosphate isomerase/epimerase